VSDLVLELSRPSAYPVAPASVELVETHISWVFLAGSHVYKLKKPVDLGFLDFRTLDQRRRACEAEVALNERLAPGVYLGVVPVCRAAGQCRLGGPGEVVDWAVHMTRLPDDRRADNLVTQGKLGGEHVDALARRLAAFHAQATCDEHTAQFGRVEVVLGNVAENFAQTRALVDRYLPRVELDELERRQTACVRARADLFDRRIAQGRVRDGHGDLRLEHVYFRDGGIDIVDCIEFSERFRFGDVCADIAFLSMDLAWRGRVDLAERLLAGYAQETNDFDLYALVDFYESYRAHVRAKVSSLVARDPAVGPALRERADREVRRYLLLALSAGRPALLPPCLVCVCGIIASGKSNVAALVANELSAPVVEADRTRKHLLGVAPSTHLDEPPWRGAYDPALTDRVYAEILRCAGVVLDSGRAVVVDASFRSRDWRRKALVLAGSRNVPPLFIECRVPPEVARERLLLRETTSVVSDARLPIYDEFRAQFDPLDELPAAAHLVVDTQGPPMESLRVVRERLQTWPRGLAG
jgi:aminoglycoside phosphotransferase family enzyme/predicted kinase